MDSWVGVAVWVRVHVSGGIDGVVGVVMGVHVHVLVVWYWSAVVVVVCWCLQHEKASYTVYADTQP